MWVSVMNAGSRLLSLAFFGFAVSSCSGLIHESALRQGQGDLNRWSSLSLDQTTSFRVLGSGLECSTVRLIYRVRSASVSSASATRPVYVSFNSSAAGDIEFFRDSLCQSGVTLSHQLIELQSTFNALSNGTEFELVLGFRSVPSAASSINGTFVVSDPDSGGVLQSDTDFGVEITPIPAPLAHFPLNEDGVVLAPSAPVVDRVGGRVATCASTGTCPDFVEASGGQRGLRFDGFNDIVTISPPLKLGENSSGSMSFRIGYSHGQDATGSLFVESQSGTFPTWALNVNQGGALGQFSFATWRLTHPGNWHEVIVSNVGFPTYPLTHVAAVWTPASKSLYINGELAAQQVFPGMTDQVLTTSRLGGYLGGQYFAGHIYDFAAWNLALTADEVEALAEANQ